MRQPKDYLTAVNLARSKQLVDRTIADSRPNWNNCEENPVYTLLRDKLRQDLTGEIKSLRDGFPQISQIVIRILKLQHSLIAVVIPADSHLRTPPATDVAQSAAKRVFVQISRTILSLISG